MWGIKLRQDLYLLLNILYLIFRTFEINNLDGYCLLRSLVITVFQRGRTAVNRSWLM